MQRKKYNTLPFEIEGGLEYKIVSYIVQYNVMVNLGGTRNVVELGYVFAEKC